MNQDHKARKLIELFNNEFEDDYCTVLVGGGEEPLYEPANQQRSLNQIIFTHDYFSSALHEVAHWCIAGEDRLNLIDYGYWYAPDGRSEEQQRLFESVEIKPQALEWIFSNACGQKFNPSADNLKASSDQLSDDTAFKKALVKQVHLWCKSYKLPSRAKIFIDALNKEFDTTDPFNLEYYHLSYLV